MYFILRSKNDVSHEWRGNYEEVKTPTQKNRLKLKIDYQLSEMSLLVIDMIGEKLSQQQGHFKCIIELK